MIIITGASRGIGRGIADHLHASGQQVIGVSRNIFESDFESFPVDVSDERMVADFIQVLRRRRERVTGLINAAGIASMNPTLFSKPSQMRSLVETNLLGTIFMSQAIGKFIVKAGGGSIVNFSTIAVPLALAGEAGYVASKAGVEAFSRVFARELSQLNVRVNTIAPGPIPTDLTRGVSQGQIESIIERQLITERFDISDVCNVVDILLDSRSRSLSGQVFHVGGV